MFSREDRNGNGRGDVDSGREITETGDENAENVSPNAPDPINGSDIE